MFTAKKQKKNRSIVGLEIEAGSVAAAEVEVNGHAEIVGYGVRPMPPGIFREGEVIEPDGLASTLKDLFSEQKLSRNVRLGIANQRIVVRALQLPVLEGKEEIEAAVRFQAQDELPMPIEQAVIDWEVIGHGVGEQGEPRMEVMVVAARRDMISATLAALREANLRPLGIDLAAFGMIRALAGKTVRGVRSAPGSDQPAPGSGQAASANNAGEAAAGDPGTPETPVAQPPAEDSAATLLINLGDVTNLAVARGSTCLFTRISGFGLEGVAQKLAERRKLTLDHSRQWLAHVGLSDPVERIEGDAEISGAARSVLSEGVGRLAEEVRRSLQYYGAQDGALPIDGGIACGPGTTIPGLVEALGRELDQELRPARVEALAGIDPAIAARLTLPFGLALES